MKNSFGSPKIDQLWAAIDKEVVLLHLHWAIFRQLFGTNKERLDILNRTAGTFFYIINNVLLDSVQLGLARLADNANSKGFKNMSLARLTEELTGATCGLETELNEMLEDYIKACRQVIKRRHKHIGHLSLEYNLESIDYLDDPSREEIETALVKLRCFMNRILLHFGKPTIEYKEIHCYDNGENLIVILQSGLLYRELLDKGKTAPENL